MTDFSKPDPTPDFDGTLPMYRSRETMMRIARRPDIYQACIEEWGNGWIAFSYMLSDLVADASTTEDECAMLYKARTRLMDQSDEVERNYQEARRRQRQENIALIRNETSSVSTAGYVYLLQSPTSAYKIGRTSNPQSRLKTFGIQLPFEVEFIALIRTDDMYELERQLHARFEHKRINGEWFALSAWDVASIKGLEE